jgi:hypothetical protein
MQSGGTDDEVLESYGDALSGLLAFDSPCELGDLEREGVNDEVVEGSAGEEAAAYPVYLSPCPEYSVHQFDDADRGDGNLQIAMKCPCLREDVSNRFASPLAGDQNAGIEDEA